jgi:putative ABC transport system permease protein
MQDLIGAKDKASILYLKLDDPTNADAWWTRSSTCLAWSATCQHSMASYLSMMTTSKYPYLSTFIDVVVWISVVIGFIVIFQAMYTAVMERTREIGILKSMGASKLYIVNVVLRETALLALGGIVLGVAFSLATRAILAHKLSPAAGGSRRRLDRTRHPDCDCRRDRRRAVSGVQGRAEGSHRRLAYE